MHSSVEEIREYLARRLPVAEFGRVSEHVHSCDACYADLLVELEKRLPIVIDFDELGGLQGWHLEGDELASYLAGSMDEVDLECARFHLEDCESCRAKVVEAKGRVISFPRYTGDRKGWRIWKAGALSASYSNPWRLAAAAILIATILLIVWTLLRPRTQRSEFAGPVDPEIATPKQTDREKSVTQPNEHKEPETNRNDTIREPGHKTTIAHSGAHSVPSRDPAFEQALIAKDLVMPSAIEILDRRTAVVVRGENTSAKSFDLISPFGTLISAERPTFSWAALDGASSYSVSVYDSALHLVGTSEQLASTSWTIRNRLRSGVIYTWIVTALRDDREIVAPAAPARAEFKVISRAELTRVNQKVASTESHAARGVLYAEAGLLDDAEREFQSHLSGIPGDDRVKRLLDTVRSWRHSAS